MNLSCFLFEFKRLIFCIFIFNLGIEIHPLIDDNLLSGDPSTASHSHFSQQAFGDDHISTAVTSDQVPDVNIVLSLHKDIILVTTTLQWLNRGPKKPDKQAYCAN